MQLTIFLNKLKKEKKTGDMKLSNFDILTMLV